MEYEYDYEKSNMSCDHSLSVTWTQGHSSLNWAGLLVEMLSIARKFGASAIAA